MNWLKAALERVYADKGLLGAAIVVALVIVVVVVAMWLGIDVPVLVSGLFS